MRRTRCSGSSFACALSACDRTGLVNHVCAGAVMGGLSDPDTISDALAEACARFEGWGGCGMRLNGRRYTCVSRAEMGPYYHGPTRYIIV